MNNYGVVIGTCCGIFLHPDLAFAPMKGAEKAELWFERGADRQSNRH